MNSKSRLPLVALTLALLPLLGQPGFAQKKAQILSLVHGEVATQSRVTTQSGVSAQSGAASGDGNVVPSGTTVPDGITLTVRKNGETVGSLNYDGDDVDLTYQNKDAAIDAMSNIWLRSITQEKSIEQLMAEEMLSRRN